MRSLAPGVGPPAAGNRETWLVIEAPGAFRVIDRLPQQPSIVMARFSDLGPDLVDRVQPNRVLCPLFARAFDAVDVLRRVSAAQWRTAVFVLTAPLPNQRMVERELRANAGGLQVDILSL